MNKKLIIFDRDGTLIEDKVYLNDPSQIVFLPNIEKALRKFRDAGFEFVVATNQSGVPRGLVDLKNLYEIHRRIKAHFSSWGVEILNFYYAPFMTDSGNFYRKPHPGMLFEALRDYKAEAEKSWMIGDKMLDVEAGHRAGMRSALYGPFPIELENFDPPDVVSSDWLALAEMILEKA